MGEQGAVRHTGNGGAFTLHVCIAIQTFFPHRCKKSKMVRKTEIFLCYLEFGHHRCFLHRSEQRTEWFARLEINRAVLYLHNDIIPEFSVQRLKFKISLLGTVAVGRRVNESTPHHDTMIRFQYIGKHIGSFGMSTPVVTRSGLSFGVCFHQKASEIGYQRINIFGFLLPPGNHLFIQRIGGG